MLIDSETLSIDFIGQTKKVYKTFEISSFSMRSPKSLLKYDSFWPQMISSSFSFHFKVFFSKATISWQYKCFLWTSSQTLVANVIAAWKKTVASCDTRVNHFPFLQKQTLLGTKNFMCHEYIKNCLKNLFEAWLSVSKKLHLSTKGYAWCYTTTLGYIKVIYFPLPVLTEKWKTLSKRRRVINKFNE